MVYQELHNDSTFPATVESYHAGGGSVLSTFAAREVIKHTLQIHCSGASEKHDLDMKLKSCNSVRSFVFFFRPRPLPFNVSPPSLLRPLLHVGQHALHLTNSGCAAPATLNPSGNLPATETPRLAISGAVCCHSQARLDLASDSLGRTGLHSTEGVCPKGYLVAR